MLFGLYFVGFHSAVFIYLGPPGYPPRTLTPFEYVPIALTITLCAGLAPRFYGLDRFGSLKTRNIAILNALITLLVPLIVFYGSLVLFYPPEGEWVPVIEVLPIGNNIAVASFLSIILVGFLGRLYGSALWIALVIAILNLQSHFPQYASVLPFALGYDITGHIDTRTRWAWIIGLAVLAITVVWIRRSVPIRIILPDPDSR